MTHERNQPRRGELWWLDWSPGRGSEQAGRRPALVIQIDAATTNPRYPNTIVVAVSTKGRQVTSHVLVQPSTTNGLAETSFVKCEQVQTVSKERLVKRIGMLDATVMDLVAAALRTTLGI